MTRFKERYDTVVRAALVEEFGYANTMEVPRLDKIVLNMGVGEASQDRKKIDGAVEPDNYYRSLRSLFDRIENELGLKVVIAGHPRADYQPFGNVFGDRKIFYGDTADLVTKSRLVLAHFSTAIGFAVMFRKPIMLLTSHELYSYTHRHKHAFECFSRELGGPLHSLDHPEAIDLSNPLALNNDLYDRYIENYIKTPGSPSKYMWNIVLDAIGA